LPSSGMRNNWAPDATDSNSSSSNAAACLPIFPRLLTADPWRARLKYPAKTQFPHPPHPSYCPPPVHTEKLLLPLPFVRPSVRWMDFHAIWHQQSAPSVPGTYGRRLRWKGFGRGLLWSSVVSLQAFFLEGVRKPSSPQTGQTEPSTA
jgi:hypothetical protein